MLEIQGQWENRVKPDSVKIIQILSHCPNSTGGGYVAHYKIYGLGDDSVLYEYNDYHGTWKTVQSFKIEHALLTTPITTT